MSGRLRGSSTNAGRRASGGTRARKRATRRASGSSANDAARNRDRENERHGHKQSEQQDRRPPPKGRMGAGTRAAGAGTRQGAGQPLGADATGRDILRTRAV